MQSYPSSQLLDSSSLPALEDAKRLFLDSYPQIDGTQYLSEVYTPNENILDSRRYVAGVLYLYDLFNDASLIKNHKAKERFEFYANLEEDQLKTYLDRWQNKRKKQADLQRRNRLVTTPKRKK